MRLLYTILLSVLVPFLGTGAEVRLEVPSTVRTGEMLTAFVAIGVDLPDYNYYIVDWGDGMWSYDGPYVYHDNWPAKGEVRHVYKHAGRYQVKACAINLEKGDRYGWTIPQEIQVSGDDWSWETVASSQSDAASPGCVFFDDWYTLDGIEIQFPESLSGFPSNITLEYTTDGGKIWYMLPHYYYVLPNSKGLYECEMNFPVPAGVTLSLPLDRIAANGIRFRGLPGKGGKMPLSPVSVDEIRVYGRKGCLFHTSHGGCYDADLSNMWTIFGTAKTEPRMFNTLGGGRMNVEPFRSGSTMIASTEWTAWNGMKLNWSGFDEALKIHVNSLKNAVYGGDGWRYDEQTGQYVVDASEYTDNPEDDGFIWATSSAPQHLDQQNHYTNNSALIIASRDYLLSGNDPGDFLSSVNRRGQVMIDKLRKAMAYMLDDLNGASGLMTIYDPRNDGTVRGVSSNYWDSLNFFGYNSAYENILFYQAVLAMADIEAFLGNDHVAADYVQLSKKIRRVFNQYFWDRKKGRYITSVNIKGDVLDFGITFVNFMAVAAGLSSRKQAQRIYDWVDGRRIIVSDTSTGEDIYHFKVSARTNTVAVETAEEDGLHYWWYNGHSYNDVLPGHWGVYGLQMQNGGTIFYTSYYDIAGRAFLSADKAISRFNVILDEFHKDALRRDPRTRFGPYLVSINGEFPESGLVPLSFVTEVVGITPQVKGLRIQGNLPSDMTSAGVSEYHYAGRIYDIEVDRNCSSPQLAPDGEIFKVVVPAGKTFYITLQNTLIP